MPRRLLQADSMNQTPSSQNPLSPSEPADHEGLDEGRIIPAPACSHQPIRRDHGRGIRLLHRLQHLGIRRRRIQLNLLSNSSRCLPVSKPAHQLANSAYSRRPRERSPTASPDSPSCSGTRRLEHSRAAAHAPALGRSRPPRASRRARAAVRRGGFVISGASTRDLLRVGLRRILDALAIAGSQLSGEARSRRQVVRRAFASGCSVSFHSASSAGFLAELPLPPATEAFPGSAAAAPRVLRDHGRNGSSCLAYRTTFPISGRTGT